MQEFMRGYEFLISYVGGVSYKIFFGSMGMSVLYDRKGPSI